MEAGNNVRHYGGVSNWKGLPANVSFSLGLTVVRMPVETYPSVAPLSLNTGIPPASPTGPPSPLAAI